MAPKCSKCGNRNIRCFVTNIGSCSLWCDACGHHSVRYLSAKCQKHCPTPKPVRCFAQCRRCLHKTALVSKGNGQLKRELVLNMPCAIGIVPNHNVKCQSWKEVINNERSQELLGLGEYAGIRSSQSRDAGTLQTTSGSRATRQPEYAKKSKQVGSFSDWRTRQQPGRPSIAEQVLEIVATLPEDARVWYEIVPPTKQDGLLPV